MSLTIAGTVLGVTRERVAIEGRQPFDAITVHLLAGLDKFELAVSREAESRALALGDGELVELPVGVSAFPRRNGGAGYRLTMLSEPSRAS